ncbi:MAG: hypothetical protein IKE58_07310 [Blautia sp.]|nr:hypothetical protein [Blautia sp.]
MKEVPTIPEKDYTEKKLEDFPDVFADIVNVFLFNGEQRVKPEELLTSMTRSSYKVEGRLDEQERDSKKDWMQNRICIAIFGLENETAPEATYPIKVISYDGADYRDQIRKRDDIKRRNKKLLDQAVREGMDQSSVVLEPLPPFYPVITLVLYFGDRRWNGSRNLKDHLTIPSGLDSFVPDYKINLFEISFLDEETVAKFKSDFRYVAEYFVQTRRKKEGLEPIFSLTLKHLTHVKEFIDLMNAITNSKIFTGLPDGVTERSDKTMMTYIYDDAYEKALKKAKVELREQVTAEVTQEVTEEAKKEGEDLFARLTDKLLELGKFADLRKAVKDIPFRKKLYSLYGIE